jgi:hypothetical protein
MSESKYTAGPWHVFRDEINDSDGLTVARVVRFVPLYREQSDANARLIAAAPDLLEALSGMVAVFAMNNAEPIELRNALQHQMAGARAAIAKAEGRS